MSYAANSKAPKGEEISESTGPVANDSLAAESIRNDGGFAKNENPEILGVKGASSTLANTDTSGAEVLHPAHSAADREKANAKGLGSDEKGATGAKLDTLDKPSFEGVTNQDGYVGGSGTASESTPSTTNTKDTTTTTTTSSSSNEPDPKITSSGTSQLPPSGIAARPYVDQAPNYTTDTRSAGDLKPKGKNITEGTGIPPNRSTFTGDVGGPHDPARVAEQDMLKNAADASSGVAARDKADVETSTGGYDALKSSESA